MPPSTIDAAVRNVGRRIAELRTVRGLTQAQLAELLTVSTRYLGSVEAGHENLTVTSLAKFAKALRVPVGDFFTPARMRNARPGRPTRPEPTSTTRKPSKKR